MTQDVDDLVVTYTVKELLAQIHDDVTIMSTKLDSKAEKADLVRLDAKLDTDFQSLDNRLSVVERFVQRAIGAAILIGVTSGGVGYALKEILGG